MRVEEVMTSSFAWCTPQTPIPEVARLMEENDCGAIPILTNENDHHLAGIVTDRDIVVRCIARNRDPMQMTAQDCMTPSPTTITPDTDLHDCCVRMEEHKVRRMPVIDNSGNCCGMVSQADIALHGSEHEVAEVVRHVSERGAGVKATM